ncbi:MAG: hypothetical protein HRF42_01215 [Candidatus Brocadia sp.]|jgi:photosystem II stability/assembly factor-like uncharacterized protein
MDKLNNTARILFFCLLSFFCASADIAGETVSPGQDIIYKWKPLHVNGGGFTNFVIINQKEPNVVYAGIDVGGVYKSTDYGDSWIPVNKGLQWPTDRLAAALTIDPKYGTLYLGVGKSPRRGGIFKSADDGKSWQLLTRKVRFERNGVSRPRGKGLIVIDPFDPKTLYAGSYKDGIFKSTNGGNTWLRKGLEGKRITSIVIDRADSKTLYVSSVAGREEGEHFQGGIYKSADGGDTWKQIGAGIDDVHQLAMDLSDNAILYAACGAAGIMKSVNGGNTWIEKNNGLEGLLSARMRLNNIKYVSLAVDTKKPGVIYAGSGERKGQIYKSVNGGDVWIKLTGNNKNIYPDGWWIKKTNWPGNDGYFANCLSVDPVDSDRIYVSGRSGIWRSDDGGLTWRPKVKGLEATCMNQIIFDPKRPGLFFVGNTDWIFFRSADGGKTFDRSLKGLGSWDAKEDRDIWNAYKVKNGLCFAIDPRHEPPVIYLGGGASGINSGAVFKSTDGGESWQAANTGLPVAAVTALAIDPLNFHTVFAAVKERGLYKTVNGGKNWERTNLGGDTVFSTTDNVIAIHPKNNNVMYVLDKGNGIYKTIDSGKNWQIISKDLPQDGIKGMDQFVGGLAVDPVNPDVVYAGLRKHGVYKTTDGGKKWKKVTPPYMLHGGAMSIDTADGSLYIASVPGVGDEDIGGFVPGVYKSADGGHTWLAVHNDDLSAISLKVTSLAIDPHSKGKIYLTTQGNGIIVGEPYKYSQRQK